MVNRNYNDVIISTNDTTNQRLMHDFLLALLFLLFLALLDVLQLLLQPRRLLLLRDVPVQCDTDIYQPL